MSTLSEGDLARYHADGFVVLRGAVAAASVAGFLQGVRDHAARWARPRLALEPFSVQHVRYWPPPLE